MTTETMPRTHGSGAHVLLGAAAAAFLVGLVVAGIGGVFDGGPAAYGAVVGTAIGVVVFASGAFVVNAVAGSLPSASLLVALLTYTLQVVLLAVVFVALTRSGALESDLDRAWLAIALIATTFGWLAAQIRLAARQRIPVYDLPVERSVQAPNSGVNHELQR